MALRRLSGIVRFLLLFLLYLDRGDTTFVFNNPANTAPGEQHFLSGWAINNSISEVGTNLNVTWSTDWVAYTIHISQLLLAGFLYKGSDDNSILFSKNSSDAETGYFLWDVDLGSFSLATSNMFFFTAENDADANYTYSFLNITEDAVTTTSTSSSSSTILTASQLSSTSNTATVTTSTTSGSSSTATSSTELATSTSSSSDSASHKIIALGLGIGLGVAMFIVVILAAALWKVSKKKKLYEQNAVHRSALYELSSEAVMAKRSELDGTPARFELQGS